MDAEPAGASSSDGETPLRYAKLFAIAAAVLVLDQLTKLLILNTVPHGANPADGGLIPVIPGFFYIIHVYNTGAAWGMFSGYSYALALLGVAALAGIYFYRRQLELHLPFMQVIFGLLIGGIIGNMIDRFAYGHVVDFLDFHFGDYRYPAFNIADSAITTGVALYLIAALAETLRGKAR